MQDERVRLDQERLGRQEILVRSRTLDEQLAESGFESAELRADMPQEAAVEPWQTRVEELASRIQRLGPINLAAIDEFKEQSERMAYLDSQHEDVSKSLGTLEDAIRKIDRETRTRFKETFDLVNRGLQQLFPRLFGGGHAYLELTGEDLLDTGVTVMARPPGKRNSSIHLLSGGEKQLLALASVLVRATGMEPNSGIEVILPPELEPSADGSRIELVRLDRQAELSGESYEPLVDVHGLPC